MQVQLEKIPQFFKAHGQFCCWQYELRDGDKTKVPYTPGTRTKKQTILIHWNFIGAVELPQEQKKSA